MNQLHDYAIVVGIEQYDKSTGLDPLPGAKADATQFAQWLRAPYCDDPLQVAQIIDKLSEVTTGELTRAFTELLDNVSRARRLYLFVAGHGGGDSLKDAYVYTTEYSPYVRHYWDFIRVAEALRYSGRFDEVILFMDCCRSIRKRRHWYLELELDQDEEREPAKHFYCLACAAGETTDEVSIDGRAQGEFSLRLMRALHGHEWAAVDRQGRVTAHSLSRYLASAGARPDMDPHDKAYLADLTLSKGFESAPSRRLEIRLTEPSKGFALFGPDMQRLAWRQVSDGIYEVQAPDVDSVVLVVVPASADPRTATRLAHVRPTTTSVEV